MANAFIVLAVLALGLTAGAVLAEGAVLVPYWRSLKGEAFLQWYRENGALLLRFFGPLEVAAAASAIAAAVTAWLSGRAGTSLLIAASVLSILVLAAFPLYFQRANASFAAGTIEPDRVSAELRRWAFWHWVRVLVASAAFLAAVAAGMLSSAGS
jgi:hypothetical protein